MESTLQSHDASKIVPMSEVASGETKYYIIQKGRMCLSEDNFQAAYIWRPRLGDSFNPENPYEVEDIVKYGILRG